MLALVMRRRRELVAANAIAIVATLFSVPLPLMLPLLVDEVLLDTPGRLIAVINLLFPQQWHGPVFYIAVVLTATVIFRLLSWFFTVWQTWIFYRVSKDVIFRIRRRLLWRLTRVSVSEYESVGGGTIGTYLVTDLETLDQFLGATVSRFLISIFTITATALVLMWLHWQLALFLLLLNPVVIYFTMAVGKHVKRLKKEENQAIEAFQQAIVETLSVVHQIRASNRDSHYVGRLVGLARKVRKYAANFAWKSDAANRMSFLIFLVSFDLFRALGMLMVLFSDLSIGEMIAVFGYLWFMLGPIQEILGMQYAWFGAKAALERVNSIIHYEYEPVYAATINPFAGRKTTSVDVDDLSLEHDGSTILNGISLHITAGEKIAIVGASGGGKTTFVQALLGMYVNQRGTISYGGVSIRQIGLETVRDNVGCVLQNPMLFNGTIRENLTLGRDVSDSALWQALEIAQLAVFVRTKPRKLETVVGLQGLKLSGGQRQRLAVARMILFQPKVAILDEATSAVDSETEADLHEALFDYLHAKTVLIVAHRLSAVRQADRVYVFENGGIIEQGKHERLIKENGLYTRLFSAQISDASA